MFSQASVCSGGGGGGDYPIYWSFHFHWSHVLSGGYPSDWSEVLSWGGTLVPDGDSGYPIMGYPSDRSGWSTPQPGQDGVPPGQG